MHSVTVCMCERTHRANACYVQAIMLEFYDRTEASKEDVHPSVESNRALEDQPIQLSTCLNVFNQGEKLTDHYCSKCSRPADGGDIVMRTMVSAKLAVTQSALLTCICVQTKQMDLYRLPPLLVIQLKRFQFNQFSRRKLYNLVMFPVQVCYTIVITISNTRMVPCLWFQGLDLSEYLSKDPVKCPPPDLSYWEFLGGKRMAVDPCGVDTAAMSSGGSQNAIGTPPIGSRERNYEGIPLSLSRDNVRKQSSYVCSSSDQGVLLCRLCTICTGS